MNEQELLQTRAGMQTCSVQPRSRERYYLGPMLHSPSEAPAQPSHHAGVFPLPWLPLVSAQAAGMWEGFFER